MEMPQSGKSCGELKDILVERGQGDAKWRDGKAAVYVFNAGLEVSEVQHGAFASAWPEGPTGAMTSGGTDSITMALKTARDYACAEKGKSGPADIVLPQSAHPGFDKAAHLMDIEVRRVPFKSDGSYEADPGAMGEACNENTVMMVGSAPNFPHGIIDPIAALGEVAEAKGVWLHTDACVGGHFAPFARINGVPVLPFDFDVPAVHSMSAHFHKYGYAAKGASTVLFRSEALYNHMAFDERAWSGAPMKTPTLAGTRPGGAISAAWAVMNTLGVEGYRKKQGLVCQTRERVEEGVKALGFEVLGKPILGLIAFRHPDHDNFAIYDEMYRKGWLTSITVDPPSLHLMLSPKHEEVIDQYLADLAQSVATVAAGKQGEKVEARYS
ncbi:MAG: aspartate aminotransferase family protein [Erythrobacter sp.]|nr:aspartate aminotransferase family protein [Erythrobacter sp.]